MIKLPNLDWFMGMLKFRGEGNIFSGSYGSDPFFGMNESKTFRYRAWVEKTDDDFKLMAAYYYGLYNYDVTDKSIITETIFEASADGIAEAQAWLQTAELQAIEKFNNN